MENKFNYQQRVRVLGRSDYGTVMASNGQTYSGATVYSIVFDDGTYHNVPADLMVPCDEPAPVKEITPIYQNVQINEGDLRNLNNNIDSVRMEVQRVNLKLEEEINRLSLEVLNRHAEIIQLQKGMDNIRQELHESNVQIVALLRKLELQKEAEEVAGQDALLGWLSNNEKT